MAVTVNPDTILMKQDEQKYRKNIEVDSRELARSLASQSWSEHALKGPQLPRLACLFPLDEPTCSPFSRREAHGRLCILPSAYPHCGSDRLSIDLVHGGNLPEKNSESSLLPALLTCLPTCFQLCSGSNNAAQDHGRLRCQFGVMIFSAWEREPRTMALVATGSRQLVVRVVWLLRCRSAISAWGPESHHRRQCRKNRAVSRQLPISYR